MDNQHSRVIWALPAAAATLAALLLAGCGGGGGGDEATTTTSATAATAGASGATEAVAEGDATATAASDSSILGSKRRPVTPAPSPVANPVAQPASTEGRLLASNCFQCHGTMGTGGFDAIRGKDAGEVQEFLTKSASNNIMAAHAQGYTPAQLQKIIAYLQQ